MLCVRMEMQKSRSEHFNVASFRYETKHVTSMENDLINSGKFAVIVYSDSLEVSQLKRKNNLKFKHNRCIQLCNTLTSGTESY
jgi:hypothetical protein